MKKTGSIMNATGGRSRKALWRRISPRVMWGDWLKWRRTKSPFGACLDLLFGDDRPRAGEWEWPWWEEDDAELYNRCECPACGGFVLLVQEAMMREVN